MSILKVISALSLVFIEFLHVLLYFTWHSWVIQRLWLKRLSSYNNVLFAITISSGKEHNSSIPLFLSLAKGKRKLGRPQAYCRLHFHFLPVTIARFHTVFTHSQVTFYLQFLYCQFIFSYNTTLPTTLSIKPRVNLFLRSIKCYLKR